MTERNKQMEAITSVKINVDALKAAFKKAGRTYAEADRMFGLTTNRISSCMYQGSMRQDELERICMLLNVKFEDMKAKEPEKLKEQKEPGVKAGGEAYEQAMLYAVTNASKQIVSYIQDLGKIQTDLLREIKELRADIRRANEASYTQADELAKQAHAAAEKAGNYYVAANGHLNKIYNQMKYGAK